MPSPPLEMTRSLVARDSMIGTVGSEATAKREGVYEGRGTESVTTSTKTNVLSMAKHSSLAHALATNLKTLSQRSVRQGQAASSGAAAKIADFHDKVLDQLPSMPSLDVVHSLIEAFHDLAEKSRSGKDEEGLEGGEEDAAGSKEERTEDLKDQALALLQGFDEDVTHQFAALEFARDYFGSEEVGDEFLEILDQAKAEFERTDVARDVRAGFAVAQLASQAAATLSTDPAQVRDTYRSMLREKRNIGELFDSVSSFDLTKKFDEVVDIFMSAAGKDLASAGPSTDKVFLHGLLTELGKLKKMRSVYESGKEVIEKTNRTLASSKKPGQKAGGNTDKLPVSATQVASRLLNFGAKSAVNPADARLLMAGLDRVPPAGRVVFANLIRDLHLEIPDDAISSPQARLQQRRELDKLLNQLVAAEEASYESGSAAR